MYLCIRERGRRNYAAFPLIVGLGVLDRLCPVPVRVLRGIAEITAPNLRVEAAASRRYRIPCVLTADGVCRFNL
jgi:hypothetical protein